MLIRNNISIRVRSSPSESVSPCNSCQAQGKYDVAEKPPAPFPQTVYTFCGGFPTHNDGPCELVQVQDPIAVPSAGACAGLARWQGRWLDLYGGK